MLYAGKIDHGFDKNSDAALQTRLKPLICKEQPYSKKIGHRGIWVRPSLLAEIEYRTKSVEGKLRHSFFKGIREDLYVPITQNGEVVDSQEYIFETEDD